MILMRSMDSAIGLTLAVMLSHGCMAIEAPPQGGSEPSARASSTSEGGDENRSPLPTHSAAGGPQELTSLPIRVTEVMHKAYRLDESGRFAMQVFIDLSPLDKTKNYEARVSSEVKSGQIILSGVALELPPNTTTSIGPLADVTVSGAARGQYNVVDKVSAKLLTTIAVE